MSGIYWAFVVYVFVPLVADGGDGLQGLQVHRLPDHAPGRSTGTAGVFAGRRGDDRSSAIRWPSPSRPPPCRSFVGTWLAVLLGPAQLLGRAVVFGLTLPAGAGPGHHLGHRLPHLRPRARHRAGHVRDHLGPCRAQRALRGAGGDGAAVDPAARAIPRRRRIWAPTDSSPSCGSPCPTWRPALIGAGIFCMLLSFDDFVRSFFLGGYEPTLPVLIFAKLRSGMSPEINAISTVLLVMTAVLGLWAERSMRQMNKDSGR